MVRMVLVWICLVGDGIRNVDGWNAMGLCERGEDELRVVGSVFSNV